MRISLNKNPAAEQTQIHFSYTKSKGTAQQFNKSCPQSLQSRIKKMGEGGTKFARLGQTYLVTDADGTDHLLVGLGSLTDINPENLRHAAAKIFRQLQSLNSDTACLPLDEIPGRHDINTRIAALTEGFRLTDYKFDTFKNKSQSANAWSDH